MSLIARKVEAYVEQLTGQDEVFWTKSGGVFHVCAAVPDVNKESKDGTIYRGTVAAAHEAGSGPTRPRMTATPSDPSNQ